MKVKRTIGRIVLVPVVIMTMTMTRRILDLGVRVARMSLTVMAPPEVGQRWSAQRMG
jgi:hypothetical protein